MKKFYRLFLVLSLLFSYQITKAGIDSVNVKSQDVSCNGDTDGYITIDSISSTAPSGPYVITITTSPVQTINIGDTIENLGQGTYTIRVTDLGDPTQIFPFNENVTVGGPLPLISNIASTPATCNGECDGQAFVQALQGTQPYSFQWDDPLNSTASTIGGLCAGTYNVTVTDANNCTTTNSVVVSEPSAIIPNAVATPIDCNGANNGSVLAAPTGGSGAGYTFLWNDPSNSTAPGVNGLSAGPYTVTVTDGAGCTVTQTVTVIEPQPIVVTISPNDVACFGESTGSAMAAVTGGTNPFTFNWSAGIQVGNMTSNLPAGNYDVTVTDGNNCQVIQGFTINSNTEIDIDLDSTDVGCNGELTGAVSATITGGRPNYSWNMTGGFSGNTPTISETGLAAGTYRVTVTDALGCVKVDSIVVNEPPVLAVTVDNTMNPSCAGGNDGSIDISIVGGTTPYNILWDDPNAQTTTTAGNLTDGTYNVTVTDANGCTATAGATITDPAPILGNIITEEPKCRGGNDGIATAVPSGGSGVYTNYEWSSMNGTDSIETGLPAGNYTVTITDSDGCTSVTPFTITEPAVLFTVNVTPNDVACSGESTGSAMANASGGATPYTFNWSGGTPVGNMTSNLAAGNYDVTSTDANGCEIITNFTINENNPIVIALDSTDVDCNGESTGSVNGTISGGRANYSWNMTGGFSGNTTTISETGLAAGTYIITVTDALGCTGIDSIVVNEPTPLIVTIDSQEDPRCTGDNNGFILITASGGTPNPVAPAYTYSWSDSPTVEDRTNLGANTYTVTATDANGCTATATATLTDPAPIVATIDSLEDASCNGFNDGFARVAVTGGTAPLGFDWGGTTTRENPNLVAGTYIVTVTDANGCQTTATAVISEPALLTASATSTMASCSGLNDGTATASQNGGTGPYTYLWSDPTMQTGITANNLLAGSYTVTVTDANNCTATATTTVMQPTTITLSINNQINVDCFGNSTGEVTIDVVGGTAPISIQWDDPAMQTGNTARNLAAGTYTAVVTDANGCNESIQVTITEPVQLVASINVFTEPTCNGIDDGTATASQTGGTGPYTYLWSSGAQTNITAVGLSGTTHTVTVTDANNCTATAQVTLTPPPSVVVTVDAQVNVDCKGSNTGSLDLSITGGTPPYTRNWIDIGVVPNEDRNNLLAGSYTLRVTDNNGCFIEDTYVITEPALDLAATFDTTDVSCNGLADGTAKVNVTGGTGPYTFNWRGTPNGALTDSIFDLAANTYQLTITDANGCTLIDSTVINEPSPIVVSLDLVTNVLCNGDATGRIEVSASGGDGGPYNFNWNTVPPLNGGTITGLTAGTYTVTATDGNNCTETMMVTVTEPDTLRPSLFVTDASCGVLNSGSAAIRASGGVGPYTYLWAPDPGAANGQGTDSIFGQSAGAYSVTVTDANGCDSTQNFNIQSVNSSYTYTDSVRNDSCFGECDGYIEIIGIAGGVAPYTYAWSGPTGPIVVPPTSTFIDNLCAGNYTVTITDATGCDSIADYTITEPAQINSSFNQNDVSCNGLSDGNARVVVTGGTVPYSYTWEAGVSFLNDSIFNLGVGTYRVTITDANNCTKTDSVLITEPNLIVVSIDRQQNVLCNGDATGEADVSATGGDGGPYTFNWNTVPPLVGNSIINLPAGTYTVTATDGNNCTGTQTVVITESNELRPTLFTVDVGCGAPNGGSAAIRMSGGVGPYNYLWAPDPGVANGQGTDSIFNIAANNYFVTVTDANGCDSIQTFTINASSSTFTFTDSIRDDSCGGAGTGYIEIIGLTGGLTPYNFRWSNDFTNNTPINDNLVANTYSLTITDAAGCDSVLNFTINEPPSIVATITTVPDTCIGGVGSATATASGGTPPYTITWPGPFVGPTVTGLAANNYFVTITDANLCEIIEPFTIGNVAPFSIVLDVTDVSCAGFNNGSIRVSTSGATNPVTYAWDPSTGLSGANSGFVGPGSYPITVTDANGCAAIDTATVAQPLGLQITTVNVTNETCNPGGDGTARAVTVGGTPPLVYDWGNGPTPDNDIDNLSAGNYSVTVVDANFCRWIENYTIATTPPFVIDPPIVTDAVCAGDANGSIQINLTGAIPPITYAWPAGSGLVGDNPTSVRAGVYIVTVTDGSLCSTTATVTVDEQSKIQTVFANRQDETCSPGMDGFAVIEAEDGVAPYIFNWGPGVVSGGNTDSVFNLVAGPYNVTTTDALMCSRVDQITIDPGAEITVSTIAEDQPDCFGGNDGSITLEATGGLAPYTYQWTFGTGATQNNLTAGIYPVTVTDAANPPCVKISSVTLGEPSPISININTTIESCVPGNDATASVFVNGGTSPFTFAFSSGTVGGSPNELINLTEGSYDVTVTDANGCQRITPFSIISAQDFSLTLTSKDPTCANGNDGEFLVNVNGGANPLIYNWTGGIAGADPKNVSAGTYDITVTDNFGCSAQGSGTLVDRAPITGTFTIRDESCIPGNDGAAKVVASGGQGAYTYQWPTLPPSDVDSIINFPSGNYTVTITDDSACVSIIPFTIGSSAPFTVTPTIDSVSCKGLSDGTITLTVTGVTVPNSETYQWSPNVGVTNINNKNQTGLSAGTYLLTVTDPANGCESTETYEVEEPDTLEATAFIIPVGCNPGGNDGGINLTTTGGTRPYTFAWTDNGSASPITTENRSNLPIGTYSVTITDANLCIFSDSYTIINQPQITIDLDSVNVTCPGAGNGRITTTTNANNPIYTWDPVFPSTPNLNNLSGGKYFVTVTDGLTNCFAVDSIEVIEPDPIVTTFTITDENCFPGNDGVAQAISTGGTPPYTYNFSGGNVIGNDAVNQLTFGSYTVTVTDQNNCSTVEMFNVGQAAPFTASFMKVDNDCAGDSLGSATITVVNTSGPVVFAWPSLPFIINPSLDRQTGLPAGNYDVTVTDPANGCSEVLSIDITAPDSIKANGSVDDENCNPGGNGSITILPTGGDSGPYSYLWSGVPNPVATQQNQSGLSAGTYSVTITDGIGCTGVETFVVNSIVTTVANLSTLNDGCSTTGACAGEAKVDPQGGVAPYTFAWSGPNGPIVVPPTADSIGSLCAGNYSVTITDASNCDLVESFTINPRRTIIPNEVIKDEECNVFANGEISVTPSGGKEPYTYNWSIPGIPTTDSLVTNLTPGTYSVTITDATGCDTIINPSVGTENFNYTLDSTDVTCSNSSDGRVEIDIIGGSTGFTFNWSGGSNPTAEDQFNLSAGKYVVTITNTGTGCAVVDSTVVNPKTSIIPNENVRNESCNSFNDGRIVLTPTGGSGSYTYNWLPNVSTNDTAKNLAGGLYTVTISDGACDTVLSVTIQSSPLITATVVTQDLSCTTSGLCDGKAWVTASNGIAPYNYDWGVGIVTGVTPDTAINLCLGTYNLTITDAGGCSIVETFVIGGPTPIAPNFVVTNSTCQISNGQLEVIPSGGNGPYTVEWFDAMSMSLGTNFSISSLASGAYSVVITDATGCSSSFNTAVNDIGAESIMTTFTDVSCFDGNDGSASVSFTCSDPGCEVRWFTSAGVAIDSLSNTTNGLVAGDYYVEVTNNSLCKSIENFTISQPTPYQVFATITDNVCGNGAAGAINLNVSGGTGSFSYQWSPAPLTGQNTNSIGGLLSTTYSVTITDGNSCDTIMTFPVGGPTVLDATFATTDANCNQADGQIVATVSGGTIALDYNYQWFDGNNVPLVTGTSDTLRNVAAGNYSLRVIDDNLCERRFNVSIGNVNGPTVVIDSTRDAGCFGESNGAIFISASGTNPPFVYNWLPNGEATEDVSNLSAGTYSVQVTDNAGCVTTIFDTIREASDLMASLSIGEATCGECNGTVVASISGGTAPYTYLWSNGDTGDAADSLCGGNYTVVVTDASGCSKAFDFGVNTVGGPTGETVSITPASCSNSSDGSATVTPIGGTPPYSYLWQHNGATTNTLNNLAAGTYFLQISDLRSCSRTVQIDITSPPAIVVSPQVVPATCNTADGSILLNVTGGQPPYSFNWGAGIPDVDFRDALLARVYSVTVSDANGCSVSLNVAVNNTGVLATATPSSSPVSCFGLTDGSLIANVNGDPLTFEYRWFFAQGGPAAAVGADLMGNADAGDYILEITSIPEQCKSFYPVTVGEPDSITLSSSIIKNISCFDANDGEVFINTRGGNILYTYSWGNNANNQDQIPASGLGEGTYSVTATDANGCQATTSVTLTNPPVLTVDVTSTNSNLLCSSDCDASAMTAVSGGEPGPGYDFEWTGGQTVQNPTNLCFGINTVTVTDSRGCQVTDDIEITATDIVIAEISSEPTICDGELVNLKGDTTGPSITSYEWREGVVTNFLTSTTLDTSFVRPIGSNTFYLIAFGGTSRTCNDTAELVSTVAPIPVVGISSPLRIFGDNAERIELSGDDPSYTYSWTPATDLDDSTFAEPVTTTRENITYSVLVTSAEGCTYTNSVDVIYTPNIEIPSGFTPNGDGANDVWVIEYLDDFPNASVQIYNRWGTLLYEASNGYVNPWDGKYNGDKLPIGTYYYVIDLKDPNFEPLTGPVTIVK